jgi:hypothetical protein
VYDECLVEERLHGADDLGQSLVFLPVRFIHTRCNLRGRNSPYVTRRHCYIDVPASEFERSWLAAEADLRN